MLTLLSGAWIPWQSAEAQPTAQLRAHRIVTPANSPEGQFVTSHLAKGVQQDLWEKLSVEEVADFQQCSIIESGFAALVGRLQLSPDERKVVDDTAVSVDTRLINDLAVKRAESLLASLLQRTADADRVGNANFAHSWSAQGGGSKFRFCVAHNRFLNTFSHGWPLTFPTAHSVLETAEASDIFITRDHKSGYSVVPIRPDQRRFFCFYDPVTGDVYRCKRLDFGWALSPGIFFAFTAELNAIISSRLALEVDRRALSRYYVDDCIVRVPRGGGDATLQTPEGQRLCTANEARAIAILDDVSHLANFPTSPEKERWGSAVVYLGLHINCATRAAVVMPSKLFKSLTMLHVLRLAASCGRIDIPVSFALKAAGNVQWLAQNFRLGRLHTPALWSAAEQLRTLKHRRVSDCPGLRATCEWWAESAATGRLAPHAFIRALDLPSLRLSFDLGLAGSDALAAVLLALTRPGSSRPVVTVLSDASGSCAIAGCWRTLLQATTQSFYAPLTPEQLQWSAICAKELLAQVTWLERFGASHRGSLVLFGTDNAGNVFAVNRLRAEAGNTVMAALLARLLAAADAHDIECLVWWCPRALNGISDALSKCPTLVDARRAASDFGIVLCE